MKVNYLTLEGFENLRKELNTLLNIERPQVVQAVSDAAAMGDRSENAEYIYGKKRLREIDRRIRFLNSRLDKVEVIQEENINTKEIRFGSWVLIEKENSETMSLQIVGPDEIDPKAGKITFSSPMGRALLGKSRNDIVTLKIQNTSAEYKIISIAQKVDELKRN